MKDTPILKAQEVNISALFAGLDTAPAKKGQKYPKNRTTGKRFKYLNILTSFDIETSSHQFGPELGDWESWLYVWQWQFGDRATVIGRTWEDFLSIVNQINAYLRTFPEEVRLMCHIHNLAFEFQFISGIWHFESTDIFATDVRSPLYCLMDHIELRCSYRLSGYNLDYWAKELHADHQKLSGTLDYKVERYPWTELTPDELQYCINDVICVVECVKIMMQSYGDTMYSLPYTATGYIRRRVREALRMWSPTGVLEMQNDLRTYDRLREAFRGGDTHANRYHVQKVIGDVYSYDRSSSYPDVICHCKFPMTKFREEEPTIENFQRLIDVGRAVIMKIRFFDLRLRSDRTGDPYIPYAKCAEAGFLTPIHAEVDNGRILSADMCELAMTDIDFDIIQSQYTWDEKHSCILWMESARYGYLPRPLIDVVIQLYKQKTSLKGVAGSEITYAHSKGEINSCYGMMVQRIIMNPVKYENDQWIIAPDFDREAAYQEAIQKAFINYAWGVYVTAHARFSAP